MVKLKSKPILAIDVGGTKIRLALVSDDGTIVSSKQYPTHADKGYQEVIKRITNGIEQIVIDSKLSLHDIRGISVAAAGIIDSRNGIITTSPNLPDWKDIPLKDILVDSLGLDVYLMNDANAAALGEYHAGVGKGIKNLVYITVSTGIGGGIVIDGELYTGTDGCAGELGHMVIEADGPQCKCGNYGCLEILASGTAIAREAQKRINQGDKSLLSNLVKSCEEITARTVSIAAKKGDLVAIEVINKAAYYLGIGMANIVNIFNPEMIIIGGSVSKMGEMLLKPARKVVKQRAFNLPTSSVSIVRSHLSDDSGIIGAALCFIENEAENCR